MDTLNIIYKKLLAFLGPQHWWPGDSPFEIAVGAILTQNTNWGNVEKAIGNLKKEGVLTARKLHDLPVERLAQLIRPSGYFNVKAKRLKAFLDFLMDGYKGSMVKMRNEEVYKLRAELLSVNGIGPETADSILLYALEKPVFVIDAYTKRILSRHNLMRQDASYESFQELFHSTIKNDVRLFNEYHALLVMTGKHFCKPKPACALCPIKELL